jgi:hypothetical protein
MVNGENADRVKVDPSRREFTAASISALFVGMGVTLTGCGGGGGGNLGTAPSSAPAPVGPATTPTSSTDKSGSVSGNHGHSATITGAQLQASGTVNLNIQGLSDHSHNLVLSADQVRQIAAGAKVSQGTSVGGSAGEYGSFGEHEHTVAFN